MSNFYFTFGSAKQFPFGRNDYVLVKASDVKVAVAAYRVIHPDITSGIVNCAYWYTQEQWDNGTSQWYRGVKPVETITFAVE